MKKFFFSVLMLGICSLVSAQQATLDKAWEQFRSNDRKKAAALFQEAASDPSTASEAYLMLSLLADADNDAPGAFKYFQEFCQLNPGEKSYPYIELLWYSSSVLNGSGKLPKERLKFLNALLADPQLPGSLRAQAVSSMGDHYASTGDFKTAKTYYDQIGSISTWSLAGEFENISGSGFDKTYDPISQPSMDAVFRNKHNAPVKWFTAKEIRTDRWVDLETYFGASNSIIFAQTFVNSPKEQKVQLRFGVSGSIKVWQNDQLIFSEEEERNNGHDNYFIETTLAAGENRILVQTGESVAGRCNFLLRITDEKGMNIQGLSFAPFPSNYKKGGVNARVLSDPNEEFFKNQVSTRKDNLLALLMLAEYYRKADREFESRKTLTEAERLAPESGYIKGRMILVYSREDNRTAFSKALEWFKANEPRNELSLNLLFNEAMEQDNYKMADSLLLELADVKGLKNEEVLLMRIRYLGSQQQYEEMIRIVEEGYKLYPNNSNFASWQASIYNQKQMQSKAIGIMKKYTDNNYSTYYLKELAGLYYQNNQSSQTIAVYTKMMKNDPANLGVISSLSDLYLSMREYQKALELATQAIELAPYNSNYWDLRARCYEEMGQPEKAEEEYKRSLELYQQDFNVRRKLRKLQGKEEDIFSSFAKRDIAKIYKDAPNAADFPDENSIVLLDETQRVVYREGSSEERHELVVKVFNAAGIDTWKEYYIPVYGNGVVEKVEVLKANGTKLEAERSGVQVVFTNLEAGDAIHVAYRVENYNYGRLEPHFTDNFAFQMSIPSQHSTYSLLIDPNVKFQHKFSNGGFEAQTRKIGNMDLYVWEKKNIPAYKKEAFMPVRTDFVEVLHLSTLPDWTWVSNWYSDLSRTKAKQDYEVKAVAQEILAGKPANLSELEKAKLIQQYIVTNIRYSQVSFRQGGLIPQKASKVINTRVGDCKDVATLFVALANEMGIDSTQLVLIQTRDNGTKTMMLPSIDFNHCIAGAIINGKQYYIELTTDKNGFSSHPSSLRGSFALKIYNEADKRSSEPFYLEAPTRTPDNQIRTTQVSFNEKNLTVDVKSIHTGDWASATRYTYADISEEDRKKKLVSSLSSDNANIKLNNFKFNDLQAISDSASYQYNYTVNNAVTQITGLNIFSMPWTDKLTSIGFFSNEERSNPMLIWNYLEFDKQEEIITMTLPAGKTLAETPKNVKLTSSIGTYEVTYQLKGSTLTAKRTLTIHKDVAPAAQYAEIKTFIEKVVAEDGKQLAIK